MAPAKPGTGTAGRGRPRAAPAAKPWQVRAVSPSCARVRRRRSSWGPAHRGASWPGALRGPRPCPALGLPEPVSPRAWVSRKEVGQPLFLNSLAPRGRAQGSAQPDWVPQPLDTQGPGEGGAPPSRPSRVAQAVGGSILPPVLRSHPGRQTLWPRSLCLRCPPPPSSGSPDRPLNKWKLKHKTQPRPRPGGCQPLTRPAWAWPSWLLCSGDGGGRGRAGSLETQKRSQPGAQAGELFSAALRCAQGARVPVTRRPG